MEDGSTSRTVGSAFTRARLTTTASSSPLPTAHDISTYRSLLFNLTINVIPKRKKTVKGRFDKYDTARRDFISNVALPNLDFGKFPTDEDDRVLFMDWNGGDTPKGSTKVALDAFADKYHRDPRSGKDALSLEEQRAIFAAANANLDNFVAVVSPSRGAPIRYRFQAGEGGFPGAGGLAGKTLRETLSRLLKPSLGTFASGLAYIKWICSSSFKWSSSLFPKHVLLYHELVFLESEGAVYYDGQGYWPLSVPAGAMEAHKRWRQEHASAFASSAVDMDSDAALLAQVGRRPMLG